MNEAAIKRAVFAEQARRARLIDASKLDAATISAGHEPQRLMLLDESPRICALCSRRAAKSVTVCAKLAKTATDYPDSTLIYFGATSKAVRAFIWGPVWQTFRRKWGVGGEDNETLMWTKFGNGSLVMFVGTDDFRHVETFLGGKLRGVVIDEAQSQPDSVLNPLIDRILPPALSDLNGWLVLSGTIPDVEAGKFYEIWRGSNGWSKRNWNRFANPHIESEKALVQELVNSGRSIDDPIIRRDWFGEFVFSNELTAFQYDRNKAGYDGNFPADLELFSVGVDPGTRDRTAIVVWGWGKRDQNVYQVYEWVTPRNSGTHLSDIARELETINRRFVNIPWWYMDMGGSNMAIDTFSRDYGLPVIAAAKKVDRTAQVKRFADLLNSGRAKIRIGSQLEIDLQRAAWDKDKRAEGKYEWSSQWHPDVGDAARYALQGYFDSYVKVPEKLDVKTADARREAELWKNTLNRPPVDYGPKKTDMSLVGFGNGSAAKGKGKW